MDASDAGTGGERRAYTTPKQVQAWFLRKSRDLWKAKCQRRRAEARRLARQVADVTKSREKWRRRAEGLEAEVAALREQRAAGGK
jgi:glutamate-1-semialdehyde aminotransferase